MILTINNDTKLEMTGTQHAGPLFAALDKNREHLSEFLPWVGQMKTVEDMAAYLANCEQLYRQQKEVSFVIFFKDEAVGRIGLHHMNLQSKTAAIGYWLAKAATGKGIVLQCCVALIRYGFTELGLNRIEIKAATANVKSQAVPERLQFVKEGILREADWVNGRPLDLVVYAQLYREWRALPGNVPGVSL